MGEGEVCVAVVSNVGEMENEKIQQKRDHQWLTDGSDMEPLAKKQAKEGSVDEEVDPCAIEHSEVALISIEREPCAERMPTNGVEPEPCVEQNMKEFSDGLEQEPCAERMPAEGLNGVEPEPCVMKECLDALEQEPCGRRQTTEVLNDRKPDTSDDEPLQQCLKATEEQNHETKQATENLNSMGVNPPIDQPFKEGSHDIEMELDPCCEKHSSEVSNEIKIEAIVEQPVKESVDEMELEPHGKIQSTEAESDINLDPYGRMQTTAAKSDIEIEPSIEQPVKECSTEMETEALNQSAPEPSIDQPVKECSTEMETEALVQSETEPSIEQPVKECLSEMEMEACGKMQLMEAMNLSESEPSVEPPIKESPSEMETEACAKMQLTKALNQHEPEPSIEQPVKECLSEMAEALNQIVTESSIERLIKDCPSEIETEDCDKMPPVKALNESQPETSVRQPVNEFVHEMGSEVCGRKQATEAVNDTGKEPSVMKQTSETLNDTELELAVDQSVKECQNEIVIDSSTKKEVKEASNDDICSEVSNPNVSPRDNSSSFQTVNSQPDGKVVMKDQVVCGEITSACSGNSSSEGSSSQEEHVTNELSATVSTSHVILEVPKHASTSSGIRKITFKFSKRKEDFDSQLSVSAAKSMGNGFDNGTRKVPRLTHVSEPGLHEPGDPLLYPTNLEVMPGKVVPDGYPTTVKRLLLTGILDGAKVKYISASGELIGIVKDCGYLCGCAACNFSNILRAHEFEEHAGGKTRHPNNHIYLENGKPIYSVIQAMKAAPISLVDEAIKNVAGSSVNEECLQVWKGSLQRTVDQAKTDNNYHMKLMNLYHSTTSCTSQTKEDGSSPYYCYRKNFAPEPQAFVGDTMKERKCLFKKPRAHTSSTAVETKRSAEGGHKKRDNDLHRLLFMPNGLPDGTELAYYARGEKILDGYKQGNGIVCSHCGTEISPSQFEAHAGWAAKRQPYRHIYIPNGLTLHDIALLLANGQSIATSNSDDMCAVCGDRGELVLCDGCPRAFHAVCLGLEGVPSEDWHCPDCRESIGSGRKAASESRPIVIRLTRVVKAREYETGGCVICRAHDFSVADFDDRTVMLCDQCEKEYHVGCLRENGICDLKALPLDKWFCCGHCDMIHGAIQDVVVNGAAILSGSVLSMINKKHIEKGVFDNEIRWRMLSGKSRYPEHLPLLSRAAAIFRECFDPIVAKSGRDLIPVMVYGRNISGQEFGGIYCVVLMVGSVVVSAGLLRIFGQEVAELPLVATSRQHQGKGYFQALFFCIEELLLSLGVELLVLPAAEEAESIWTKKLGFKKMSDERYTEYSRDIQLTIFKGTSMLEKHLRL